ncbi:hypothetical protein BD289DRAFT_243610 [Coniella lustricola]|uniref:Uncharacterized protein n=1 Tax=Coniella lustricola TaxID=2025994 RepID=A0A2T3A958_9PEZI|nr:hypothetical protein BD289DRAFT_243610 [Coniella lustricola]
MPDQLPAHLTMCLSVRERSKLGQKMGNLAEMPRGPACQRRKVALRGTLMFACLGIGIEAPMRVPGRPAKPARVIFRSRHCKQLDDCSSRDVVIFKRRTTRRSRDRYTEEAQMEASDRVTAAASLASMVGALGLPLLSGINACIYVTMLCLGIYYSNFMRIFADI